MKKILILLLLTFSFTLFSVGFQRPIPWGIFEEEVLRYYPNAYEDEEGALFVDIKSQNSVVSKMQFYVFANGLQTIIHYKSNIRWDLHYNMTFDSLCHKYGNPAVNLRNDKVWESRWILEDMVVSYFWKKNVEGQHYIVYEAPPNTDNLF
jgi:hypothetical protein